MKITALEEYGLRCMVLLARGEGEDAVTLNDVSEREALSVPYVAKLMNMLKKAGLVEARRGRNGGYTLARPAERIALREVFDALGTPLYGEEHCKRYRTSGQEGDEGCVHLDDCVVRDVWSSFHRLIGGLLERITLADVASKVDGERLDLFAIAGVDASDFIGGASRAS